MKLFTFCLEEQQLGGMHIFVKSPIFNIHFVERLNCTERLVYAWKGLAVYIFLKEGYPTVNSFLFVKTTDLADCVINYRELF